MAHREAKPGTSRDSKTESPVGDVEDVVEDKSDTNINIYPANDKPLRILGTLDKNRETGDFCDVQIKLSPGHVVHAHKVILCACSPYFEGMFTSAFMEATSDVIDLSHMTENSEIVENVINSFYGHTFEILAENVVEILNLANMLLINDLKEACIKKLRTIIGLHNAADMLQVSFSFNIIDLRELVSPIVESRFHDYIMLQEDLVEVGPECFEYILQKKRGYISRKADYIRMILKWFNRLENDDRAEVAIKGLTTYRRFPLTKYVYQEVESSFQHVINNLQEVNSDISPQMREQFKQVLEDLKPDGYDTEESYESDIEEPRQLDLYMPHSKTMKFIGPRTEAEGYTEKELAEYAQHNDDIEQLDTLEAEWNKYIAKKREKNKKMITLADEDPERDKLRNKLFPIRVRQRKSNSEFVKRNLKVKTAAELEEESRLLDMAVVLAPSSEYLDGTEDDTMIVCGYVPRKNAWYKLGSLHANDLKGRRRGGSDMLEGAMDPEHMMDMMEDMPEMMMMMRDMPGQYRHRVMKQMSRRNMSPRHMHRMMMDMEEDMPFHPMMMRPDMFRHRSMGKNSSSVNSLLKGKWKMAYLKQTLYFYHKENNGRVWSYDLVEQMWKEYGFSTRSKSMEANYFTTDEALDLIVMGQTLYAVVTLALLDTRNDFWSNRSRSESTSRTIKTKFLILKLTEKERFEMVFETDSHESYLDKDQFEKQEQQEDTSRYPYENATPMLPDVIKTVLFREDDEKLDIFLMHRCGKNDNVTYRPSFMLVVYLDLLDEEKNLDTPYNNNFLRELTPLVHDDMMTIVSDDLEVNCLINLAKPEEDDRLWKFASFDPEDYSLFLEAEEHYPKCPVLTTNNGRSMWVFEGRENDITRMTEVRPKAHQDHYSRKLGKWKSPPPPFRCFSLACPGRIDRQILRRYNPPTKYLHV